MERGHVQDVGEGEHVSSSLHQNLGASQNFRWTDESKVDFPGHYDSSSASGQQYDISDGEENTRQSNQHSPSASSFLVINHDSTLDLDQDTGSASFSLLVHAKPHIPSSSNNKSNFTPASLNSDADSATHMEETRFADTQSLESLRLHGPRDDIFQSSHSPLNIENSDVELLRNLPYAHARQFIALASDYEKTRGVLCSTVDDILLNLPEDGQIPKWQVQILKARREETQRLHLDLSNSFAELARLSGQNSDQSYVGFPYEAAQTLPTTNRKDVPQSPTPSESSAMTDPLARELYSVVGDAKLARDRLHTLDADFRYIKMNRQADREDGIEPSIPDIELYEEYFDTKRHIVQEFAEAKVVAERCKTKCEDQRIEFQAFDMPELDPRLMQEPVRRATQSPAENSMDVESAAFRERVTLGPLPPSVELSRVDINAWRLGLPRFIPQTGVSGAATQETSPSCPDDGSTYRETQMVQAEAALPLKELEASVAQRFVSEERLSDSVSEPLIRYNLTLLYTKQSKSHARSESQTSLPPAWVKSL